MEIEHPFRRVETDSKYRLYVPITRPLIKIASDLFPKWPLTSGEMYDAMVVFDESVTRESSYGKQLYEEAQLNLSDDAYAESEEGQWERATLCVGKTGRVLWEDQLVLVQLKRLKLEEQCVEVLANRCDYRGKLKIRMTVEVIITIFERSEN
ncbi:hypothetical protein BJX96DRAFT_158509 [Aspergillus floccosus]